MSAVWNSMPRISSLFSHASDNHGPWRGVLRWWSGGVCVVLQRPHGVVVGHLGVVLPGWARPDTDFNLSFTEGVWAVASHPGAAAMNPEEEASAVCAHHLSCTGMGG